eukprot:scaffold5508_cov104-Cylindrotheca_fusiformis.AAC.3
MKQFSVASTLNLVLLLCQDGQALSPSSTPSNGLLDANMKTNGAISRRTAIVGASLGALSIIKTDPSNAATDSQEDDPRSNLLRAIQQKKPETEVMQAINKLIPLNPAKKGPPSWREDLEGEWKLIWSANDEFSPLLRLPKPFKPDSYQYFGQLANAEVGEGRVAQGLTNGIFGTSQAWLSSGIQPLSAENPYMLEIEPPFRLQLGGRPGTGTPKTTIVEAGNDADFRKVNARTVEAQQAPKNIYEQLYVERNGKGSLRISTITDGDPVIVGTILIHEKM